MKRQPAKSPSTRSIVREITIILVIKVIVLLTIKHIWFNEPTIPKEFDQQAAERITGGGVSVPKHQE